MEWKLLLAFKMLKEACVDVFLIFVNNDTNNDSKWAGGELPSQGAKLFALCPPCSCALGVKRLTKLKHSKKKKTIKKTVTANKYT